MPYVNCPSCRLSLYSAASHSWNADGCPICGASLAGATRRFEEHPGGRAVFREFPSAPSTVSHARHAIDGLYGELGDSLHAVVALLISELVTNSVLHADATSGVIELGVCVTGDMIRVEVSDDGQGFDLPEHVATDAEAGRGLQLVEELADRWGRPIGLCTCVWFEIDRAPSALLAEATVTKRSMAA